MTKEELETFEERLKRMGREKPKPTLIFKECEFEKFAHLIEDAIKRDYEITSKNGEVKFTPKKRNDMKALFNCSVIKNVYLRVGESYIQLEITYTDDPNITWKSRKSIDNMCDKQYHKGMYEKAYNTIKQALLNNDKFVEVEL